MIKIQKFLYMCILVIFIPTKGIKNPKTAQNIITNLIQNDGFGSQFQNIIATVIYAEINNKKFLYTPFQKMEHNYNDDLKFIAKKEWLINFKNNFELNEKNKAIPQKQCKIFFDKNITKCTKSLSLKKIKNIFRANKHLDTYFDNKNINIAIHIRRPNNHDNRLMGANTPDNVFLKIINNLRSFYTSTNLLFHIYSQGTIEMFKSFHAPDIKLHINESLEDTFISMVIADILVISQSSFSYTAGLLSDGKVYYIPFWHKPLPHWKNVNTLDLL